MTRRVARQRIAAALLTALILVVALGAEGDAGNKAVPASPSESAAGTQTYFDPITGYRIGRYRAPQPEGIEGAERVDAADVEILIKESGAILIDVMPSDGAGLDRASGTWRLVRPHFNIPGSHWLPDVGHGTLDPVLQRYFSDALATLTEGDRTRPLIIYCQADCWMSWNAVRRARELGYSRLYWFAEGTDGWRDWDLPPVPAIPRPVTVSP